jgi:prepilin-type processing-associated H-X9-DG protein
MPENENTTPPQPKRYSPFAIAALLCFIFGWCFPAICFTLAWLSPAVGSVVGVPMIFLFPLFVFSILISPVLAIIGLLHVYLRRSTCKGLLPAWFVLGTCTIVVVTALLARPYSYRTVCRSNLGGLAQALKTYAADHDGKLPPSAKWCDALMINADVYAGTLVCQSSDARKGESSYAMNKFVSDANFSRLPPDVVILFETDLGRDPNTKFRTGDNTIDVVDVNGHPTVIRGTLFDKNRWNQCGGPELLTASHHGGKGANILFADGHVEFVLVKDFPKLRWKP